MNTATKTLTANQADALAIIEAGSDGATWDAVARELQNTTDRLTDGINRTLHSLVNRGTVTLEVIHTHKSGAYGVYLHRTRILRVA